MAGVETIGSLSKKYSMSKEEFIRYGSRLTLKERKRNLQIERLEILSRYEAETVKELGKKIKEGKVPEHPAWEDLIEIKNIDSEIVEIENDIKTLQAA
ncbi:MAG: hypothetical protein Q8M71_00260 [Thermodesulfovibrionales bacterium]|nr:hypothetical protein [Thermodesulfovibrionales bacterium]